MGWRFLSSRWFKRTVPVAVTHQMVQGAEGREQFELGRAFAGEGRFEDAANAFNAAIQSDPRDSDAYLAHAYALKDAGRIEAAMLALTSALERFPHHPRLLNGLGLTLSDLGRLDEALNSYQLGLATQPEHAGLHNNLAALLLRMGRLDQAIDHARIALRIDPNLMVSLQTLKEALFRQGAVGEALDLCHQIVMAAAADVAGLMLRAAALEDLDLHEEALAEYLRAAERAPTNPYPLLNAGLSALRLGRPDPGWRLWQARLRMPGHGSPALEAGLPGVLWDGQSSLAGQRIFLYPEQGYGDAVQFLRYVPLLSDLGAKIVIGLGDVLEPLYRDMPDAELVRQHQSIGEVALHCSITSIPAALYALGQQPAIPPPYRPRGAADERGGLWSDRLGPKTRPRVGVVVSGNPAHSNDQNRSIALSRFTAMLGLPFDFLCLQSALRSEDQLVARKHGLRIFPELRDFADTAALAGLCDLVISVDSAPAHVAASLDTPVWLMLPHLADWRWGTDTPVSPWYPSMRLYRQGQGRQWQPVIDALVEDLRGHFLAAS